MTDTIALRDRRIRAFLSRTRDARDSTDPRGDPATDAVPGASAARSPTDRTPARQHALARAVRLADALGGWVEQSAAGNAVVVESSVWLPLEPGRLAGLPFALDPARPLVCLDTETTGLGTGTGTFPFLVGIGIWSGERMIVRQAFLPDQPDEPAFLSLLDGMFPSDPWLVTYNGRSFDWPLITARYRLHARAVPRLMGHLDLLPVARQLWRHRLADARLGTVEAGVAGVHRTDDLPGALVPQRYFQYLRTGDGWGLRDVARHNLQDIVSLGMLLVELAHGLAHRDAWRTAHPGDLWGLSSAYLRIRAYGEALESCDAAIARIDSRAQGWGELLDELAVQRARLLWRLGRRADSHEAWLTLATSHRPVSGRAWIQVAKYREHVTRDPDAALEAVDGAARWAERRRLIGRPEPVVERDLDLRRRRLLRRIGQARSGALPRGRRPSRPTGDPAGAARPVAP